MDRYKIMISGGGTGGHIFPAISIANELFRRFPDVEILFIGAENRMEMERIPAAGFRIIGLPVSGYNRNNPLKNFTVIIRLLKSLWRARIIIRDFQPDIAIGVGGYASGPTLWIASLLKIPTLIQEQNSYAGLTNKLLGKRATKICVAYRGMDKYFPENRIVLTGNPIRNELEMLYKGLGTVSEKKNDAFQYFGLETDKPVLLILGGSLGAHTINHSMLKGFGALIEAGVQVIWQTGKSAYNAVKEELQNRSFSEKENIGTKGLWISDFISRMDYAYIIADLVVSRAGAGTLSELCLLNKATLLVPSPNVAEDHQTKNARTLSDSKAAVLIADKDAEEQLTPSVIELLNNKTRLHDLSKNIALFAQHNSAERIVDEAIKLIINNKLQRTNE